MTGESSAVLAAVQTYQAALACLYTIGLCDYRFPSVATVSSNATYDYVVVGSGTAGSIIANRLSENSSNSVLLIEAGGMPGIESILPGLFTLLPKSDSDWNYTTVNDNYTAQNLLNNAVSITAGKMLGGSSSIQHMIHFQGCQYDFELWAESVNDQSWNYTNILEYFIKSEKLEDSTICNSSTSSYHGQSGNLRIKREENAANTDILNAMAELGCEVKNDVSGPLPFGVCEPLLNIADGVRQCGAQGYLHPIRNRTNLNLLTYAKVTHILTNGNNVTTGVQYVNSSGVTNFVFANKEVILCAGAIGTPHILLNSGIGPKSDLEAAGISAIADLPVGKTLRDHLPFVFLMLLNSTAITVSGNPHEFPVGMTTAYMDYDSDGYIPEYQVITLMCPPKSAGLQQLCLNGFQYKEEVCQKMYDANSDSNAVLVILNTCHPFSTGTVSLNTTDPLSPPIIETGIMSNETDLVNIVNYIEQYVKILDTPTFKALGAEYLDLGLCNDTTKESTEYWKCYAVAMTATMWHQSGTCSMGPVLNSRLQVLGIENLRVVDASAMPSLTSGNINAAVVALAEKGASMILADNGTN